MARRRKQEHNETVDRGGTPITNVIAKEESEVSSHADSMARRRKHKHLIKKIFFLLKQNRSQNEESKVSNHADSMASRRKKDHDKSEEGGTVINKSRSQTKSF